MINRRLAENMVKTREFTGELSRSQPPLRPCAAVAVGKVHKQFLHGTPGDGLADVDMESLASHRS